MRKLSNIQVLRGLAALAVVVFHARQEIEDVGIETTLPSFLPGAFGVDVFFVISGFVMLYACAQNFGDARSILPFFRKRMIRIVPLYWIITALFAALSFESLVPQMGYRAFAVYLGTSLAFVPYLAPMNDDSWPIYPLGWTLDYEMFFYLCFSLVLVLPRNLAVLALMVGFMILVGLGLTQRVNGGLAYLASTQILEFVAGMLLAQGMLAGWKMSTNIAAALVVGGLVTVVISVPSMGTWWGWRGLVWGPPAVIVAAAFAFVPPPKTPGPLRLWLERLGDASYALYLVHYAIYAAVATLFPRLFDPNSASGALYATVLVIGALVVAFAVHHGIEMPMIRRLNRPMRLTSDLG